MHETVGSVLTVIKRERGGKAVSLGVKEPGASNSTFLSVWGPLGDNSVCQARTAQQVQR